MTRKVAVKKAVGGRVWHMVVGVALLCGAVMPGGGVDVRAGGCSDVRVVFARGSGGERWKDKNYLEFKRVIEEKLITTSLDYEFIDLDYPAVGVGIDKIETTLGAYFGKGDAYEFGESVKAGVENLIKLVNGEACPGTKYVIGGYSQGAMVVSRALGSLNGDKIIYAATFGDPKIYLPEGAGIIPAACKGENLSDYRMYVPDCQAYKGMLGAYVPYEPDVLTGKVGTWCNKKDIFCSSHLNIDDHVAYIDDGLYEDASRVIFDKVAKEFGLENRISSPHDTAILIDSTGSMRSMINQYKEEAYRLARETLESGGRVALYDYRDLADPYQPVQHCDFESCTLEVFVAELDRIGVNGGGDSPESLLSGALKVMKDLKWKYGSTKSLVVLTDADFLSPDRDGVTFDEVVALSKKIDPVNFYIITKPAYGDYYKELASVTDGKVVTNFDELSLLTDYIMERYDALLRIEEGEAVELPRLEVLEAALNGVDEGGVGVRVKFTTTGEQVLLALNDKILGLTEENEVILTGLDARSENKLTLVPIGEDVRGEAVEVDLNGVLEGYGEVDLNETLEGYGGGVENSGLGDEVKWGMVMQGELRVPNAGKVQGKEVIMRQ